MKEVKEINPFNEKLKSAMGYTAGLGSINLLGVGSPNPAFTNMTTTFSLGCIVGYHTVGVVPSNLRDVTPAGVVRGTGPPLAPHVRDKRHLRYHGRGRAPAHGWRILPH